MSGITAAAWVPSAQAFYLLKPSTREYFVLSTNGSVTGPTALKGTGTVAQYVFGASATDVFFVTGTTLVRQPISGAAELQRSLPGPPTPALLTGAYANGWFFVGNAGGACQALQDGMPTLDSGADNLSGVYVVTTDVTSFAFRTIGAANQAALHRIAAGAFALNSSPCSAGAFSTNSGSPVGVYGSTVAWVIQLPLNNPYQLNVATLSGGTCSAPAQVDFGTSGTGSQAVGLIDDSHALVTPTAVTGGSATIAMLDAQDQLFTRATRSVSMGANGFPVMFVVGREATTHHAVLVTKNIPALISF